MFLSNQVNNTKEVRRVPSLSDLFSGPGTVTRGLWEAGSDNVGLRDVIPVIAIEGIKDGPTLWVQGSIHGDEPNSSWVVTSLTKEVEPNSFNGRLVLLPILNMAAFRARVTPTPVDNVELYRAFPGNPNGSYTYQLANEIEQELLKTANYLIDVHSGTSIHFCTDFTSYPGGLQVSQKAEEIALAAGCPIVVRRNIQTEAEKHIMFVYASAQGIPSIMISNGGHRRVEPEFTQPLVNQCLNVMRYLGMLPGEFPQLDRSRLLQGIFYTFCRKGGFVFNEAQPGDWLVKDQVIARLYDVFGREVDVVRCPHEKAQLIEVATGVLHSGELIGEFFVPLNGH